MAKKSNLGGSFWSESAGRDEVVAYLPKDVHSWLLSLSEKSEVPMSEIIHRAVLLLKDKHERDKVFGIKESG